MTQPEKQLTEKESLDLIAMMINKAKDSYHNTGIGAIMWGTIIAVCALVKLAELQFDFSLTLIFTGLLYWPSSRKFLLPSGKKRSGK